MSKNDIENQSRMSWQARFLRKTTSWYMSRIDPQSANVQRTRKRLDLVAGIVPMASGVSVTQTQMGGLDAEWLTPDSSSSGKLLLYWHGGGYVMGSCKSHRPVVSHIARAAGVRALLPEYRLAPEHPFPAAIEDAVRVYRALLDDGYVAESIAVAGDSAGGGLTVAMLLALREAGVALPRAVGLMSPWLDLTCTGETMVSRRHKDPWFRPEDLPYVIKHYCDATELDNPLASPVYADTSDFPQTLIQVGNDEILLSDSERLAKSLRESGVRVEISVWPGMWHVWQMFIGLMPESRAAIDILGRFVRQSLLESLP